MEIIKIGAMWCPACLVMKKIWPKIEEDYNVKIKHLDLDFDVEEVKPYNVGDILPVIVIKKDGKEIKRIIGEKNYDSLKKEIDEIL